MPNDQKDDYSGFGGSQQQYTEEELALMDMDDDILGDDEDDIYEDLKIQMDLNRSSQSDAPSPLPKSESRYVPVEPDLQPGEVMGPFGTIKAEIQTAVSEHHAEAIIVAAEVGQKLDKDQDPVMIVARGVCPDELDHAYHQSEKSVAAALGALRATGYDLNAPIQGEDTRPAAHRVTAYYGASIISNMFDESTMAEVGMSDQRQASRLAEFARAGVDFSAVDDQGRRPLTMLKDMAIERAKAEGVDAKSVVDHVDEEYQQVKSAAREFRVNGAVSTEVDRQKALRSKRSEKTSPALGE